MAELTKLAKGVIPNTEFTYESLEGHLASFYKTYSFLQKGELGQRKKFRELTDILEKICDRFNLQHPADAVSSPRGEVGCFDDYRDAMEAVETLIRDFGFSRTDPEWVALKDLLFLNERIFIW